MDCKPSDTNIIADTTRIAATTRLAQIRVAVRDGNWDAADSMARTLGSCLLPLAAPELEGYLAALRQTVLLARASRSVAAAALARVRAAAQFGTDESLPAHRQDFGDLASFSRPQDPAIPASSST